MNKPFHYQKYILMDDTHTKKHEQNDIGNILYSFETLEHIDHKRGPFWMIGLGCAVLLGVAFGIYQDALSLILVSIAAGAVYTLTYNKKSPIITVQFTNIGIVWRNNFFAYQTLKTFWIHWIPGERKTLHIIRNTGFPKEIMIPLEGQDMEKIRDTLGYYVPETEGVEEKLGEVLSRKLKL